MRIDAIHVPRGRMRHSDGLRERGLCPTAVASSHLRRSRARTSDGALQLPNATCDEEGHSHENGAYPDRAEKPATSPRPRPGRQRHAVEDHGTGEHESQRDDSLDPELGRPRRRSGVATHAQTSPSCEMPQNRSNCCARRTWTSARRWSALWSSASARYELFAIRLLRGSHSGPAAQVLPAMLPRERFSVQSRARPR